jgi:hypothetical protein
LISSKRLSIVALQQEFLLQLDFSAANIAVGTAHNDNTIIIK